MNKKDQWDTYFLRVADAAAGNSKCLSRRIGAVIVSDDRRIVSTGYNGPPRGIPHCNERCLCDDNLIEVLKSYDIDPKWASEQFTCPRKLIFNKMGKTHHGSMLDLCIAGHAERNALLNVKQNIKDCTMYLTCGIPCSPCMTEIINSGMINEIVGVREDNPYDKESVFLLEFSKIHYRVYKDHVIEKAQPKYVEKFGTIYDRSDITVPVWRMMKMEDE